MATTTSIDTSRPFGARIAQGVAWRVDALRHRLRDARPYFVPVLRELHATTGRGIIDLGRDLATAWQRFECDPLMFAELMMWDVSKERWHDHLVGPELNRWLERTLAREDRVLSRDKAAFADVDRRHGLPWLETLAVINRREGPAIEGAVVIDRREQLWPSLSRLFADRDLVLKPSCAQRGAGFFFVSSQGRVRDGDGLDVTPQALTNAVFEYKHRFGDFGYLVQPALTPHPDIVALTGIDTLTTVRVVTAFHGGDVHVIESFLKIPGPGKLTDNFRDGTTGTLISGFDPETGELTDLVGLLRPEHRFVLERTAVHPASGRRIAGTRLRFARPIVDLAFRSAHAHPHSAAIGWDIALAASGLYILDGNPNWGPGWQPCTQVGLRPLLSTLYPHDFRPPSA